MPPSRTKGVPSADGGGCPPGWFPKLQSLKNIARSFNLCYAPTIKLYRLGNRGINNIDSVANLQNFEVILTYSSNRDIICIIVKRE